MNKSLLLYPLLLLLAACAGESDDYTATDPAEDTPPPTIAEAPRAFEYPETATVEVSDEYHGVTVADPFRWLEDDVRESERVAEWVSAQNALTRQYLDALTKRSDFETRLTELWNFERFALPVKRGDRYFYTRNDGLQNQSPLYVQDALNGEPRLLIDPNVWSDDGTVGLAQWVVSPEGSYVAYGIQDGGSDWRTWRVLDVETGDELTDELRWLKFTSVAWLPDESGFFYSRYPEPQRGQEFQSLNLNQQVYFHALGDAQADDRLVYERPDEPEWGFSTEVTEAGDYLVITIWKGTDARYQIATLDLADEDAEPRMLIEGFDHDYNLAGNDGSTFWFSTNKDAPRNRLVAIDLDSREPREIIAEQEQVMQSVSLVGGHFIASYLDDAKTRVQVFVLDGGPVRGVELPGIGTAGGFSGSADDPETFYSFTSYNQPPALYRYDVASGESTLWKEAEVPIDPDDYMVEQVFYTSKDGTRVPMFISHRRDLERDGRAPTLLYGYGGFNISLLPSYSVQAVAWMERGGIYAVANLRGGGEYGRDWHQAGTRTAKQNVFDDFIAAAEYLVGHGYTSPEHLGIYGRSNGGLLVGAVVNQRPDLFAAALPAVGVMDMLRFNQFTAGRFWVDDYGSPRDAEEFEALYAYSPYHNIEDSVSYPAVLITTADTDDRVVPGHSFKYAARLQQAGNGDRPALIRIEERAGHGAGTPVSKTIEMYADMWAFLAENTGMGKVMNDE